MTDEASAPAVRVAVLADDLLWATRLVDLVRRAGAEPVPVRRPAALDGALVAADALVVDLTARAYDGLDALRRATAAGVPSVAVGQHDDAPLRRAARDAGAERVYAYRALFERGEVELGAWIAGVSGGAGAGR